MNLLSRKSSLKCHSGQAAIEFIAVIVVIFFFLLFFLSLSFVFVVSDYIEYATFMAARTYRSAHRDKDIQFEYARRVFDTYTSKIQGIARDLRLEQIGSPEDMSDGVRGTYTMDLFYLPPLFVSKGVPDHRLPLTTETRLGRDPSFQECQNFFRSMSDQFNLRLSPGQMEDNGC